MLEQLLRLVLLAVPIACISWTVTHEDVFAEVHDFCLARSQRGPLLARKFFYLFTCEYCFSHWVTLGFLALADFRMVFADWRGLIVAGFSLVWVANVYMSLFGRLRLDIKHERHQLAAVEQDLKPTVHTASR